VGLGKSVGLNNNGGARLPIIAGRRDEAVASDGAAMVGRTIEPTAGLPRDSAGQEETILATLNARLAYLSPRLGPLPPISDAYHRRPRR